MPEPTQEQQEIKAAIARGESIIVNALAGAAKTTTIEMAGKEISQVLWPSCIALAFNKEIQLELEKRLPFAVKTLNGLGHTAWMKVVGKVELDAQKMSKLLKRIDASAPWDIARLVSMAKLNGLIPQKKQYLATSEGILPDMQNAWEDLAADMQIDLWKINPQTRERVDLLPVARRLLELSIDEAFSRVIDFDDQIYMSTCFGGVFPKFHTVFVDEAQDLSPLNHLMLKCLSPKQLVAVGDPLQSIYAFRGADTESMPKLQRDWELRPYTLSVCFRCSKEVAQYAKTWAPQIKSPEWVPQGQVQWLPSDKPASAEDSENDSWNFTQLPPQITVLCRNNAPLIKLALKVFKKKRIAFLNSRAKDSMLSSLRKICNYKKHFSPEEVEAKAEGWRAKKLETEDPKFHERIMDEADALSYCAEEAKKQGLNYEGLELLITSLFQHTSAEIWFGTGHAAKGKEWDAVLHLDPWRLPSKWAKSAEALQQEENIHYVITTRAKKELYHASLSEYEDAK